RVLASPAYLRSCGIDPTLAKEKMRVASPSVVCPSTTAWAPMRQPAPTRTWGPITAYGPTVTPASSSAPRATTAVGWTVGPADGPRPGLDLEHPVDQRVGKRRRRPALLSL